MMPAMEVSRKNWYSNYILHRDECLCFSVKSLLDIGDVRVIVIVNIVTCFPHLIIN